MILLIIIATIATAKVSAGAVAKADQNLLQMYLQNLHVKECIGSVDRFLLIIFFK